MPQGVEVQVLSSAQDIPNLGMSFILIKSTTLDLYPGAAWMGIIPASFWTLKLFQHGRIRHGSSRFNDQAATGHSAFGFRQFIQIDIDHAIPFFFEHLLGLREGCRVDDFVFDGQAISGEGF